MSLLKCWLKWAVDMATSCYEHACTKHPNNLELMMGLFNCYVREYSFVKQQQVGAMHLFVASAVLLMITLNLEFVFCCL